MIVLDMALTNDVLTGPSDGPWELTDNWEKITVYIVCDFVSVRNLRALIEKLSVKRGCLFNQKQIQIFSKVLCRFVGISGDWHVGLNILVTIYSL